MASSSAYEPVLSAKASGLTTTLRRIERAARALGGLTLLIAGIVLAGLVLGGVMLLDAALRFGGAGRWTGFFLVLLPLGLGLAGAARHWLHRRNAAAVARGLEIAGHRDDNALINAVQLDASLPGNSPWRAAARAELAAPLQSVAWGRAFAWQRFLGWCSGLAGLALAALICYAIRPADFPRRIARVLQPSREIAPITRTRIIDLQPGDRMVPRGSSLAVQVLLDGKLPEEVWLTTRADSGRVTRQAMTPNSDATRWETTRQWDESTAYSVSAGDAVSFERRIHVRQPAKPVNQSIRIQPPAYTKLPTVESPDGKPWPPVPAGSVVAVALQFDQALQSLRATDASGAAVTTSHQSANTWSVDGTLAKSREWKLQWTDANGMEDARPLAFTLKPDEAPKIHVTEPGGDGEVLLVADGWLKLAFDATDDYGLADVSVFLGDQNKPDARRVDGWTPGVPAFSRSLDLPMRKLLREGEMEAVFSIVARDNNTVTGSGITWSRPVVVRIVSAAEMQRAKGSSEGQWQASLEDLVQLQRANLEGTSQALQGKPDDSAIGTLVERQSRVELMAREILQASTAAQTDWRATLATLADHEIPAAALALRDAATTADAPRRGRLRKAEALETAILARLQALPGGARDEAIQRRIRDLIARVESLFQRQKALHAQSLQAEAPRASALARDQDALAEESQSTRKALADGSNNASLGDASFRAVLAKAAAEFPSLGVYEGMLRAAEKLEQAAFPAAADHEKQVLVSLAKILGMLNSWQSGKAGDAAQDQRDAAADIQDKLGDLIEKQKDVVEKSKELASKDEFRPEDIAVAKELAAEKKDMATLIEQMLTDAHVFPDLRPMNELREELTQIFEDVIQADKEAALAGQLKPHEIAVQKEESLLAALEKAKETSEDMEMWLPDKNETEKWLLENFDQTEMPEIPNVPLADSFTDLVGNLLEEQQGLAEEVQDAASNQAFATNPANGWDVKDGPMPGFNAQGRSGNERPNKNEQTGRSSGGREGMSSGEMVNQRADNLEGSKPNARRTNDPFQKGQIQDDAPPADARATGGGKAGGASQREGMTGAAPLREVRSPRQSLNDALAAEQALLSQQTARSYATARLFYLRTGPLPEVATLMDESRAALKAGRMADFQVLHHRIVGKLQDMQGGNGTGEVSTLRAGAAAQNIEKRLSGGEDEKVPAGFEDEAGDYFRALDKP